MSDSNWKKLRDWLAKEEYIYNPGEYKTVGKFSLGADTYGGLFKDLIKQSVHESISKFKEFDLPGLSQSPISFRIRPLLRLGPIKDEIFYRTDRSQSLEKTWDQVKKDPKMLHTSQFSEGREGNLSKKSLHFANNEKNARSWADLTNMHPASYTDEVTKIYKVSSRRAHYGAGENIGEIVVPKLGSRIHEIGYLGAPGQHVYYDEPKLVYDTLPSGGLPKTKEQRLALRQQEITKRIQQQTKSGLKNLSIRNITSPLERDSVSEIGLFHNAKGRQVGTSRISNWLSQGAEINYLSSDVLSLASPLRGRRFEARGMKNPRFALQMIKEQIRGGQHLLDSGRRNMIGPMALSNLESPLLGTTAETFNGTSESAARFWNGRNTQKFFRRAGFTKHETIDAEGSVLPAFEFPKMSMKERIKQQTNVSDSAISSNGWEEGWYHGTPKAFGEFSPNAPKTSGTIEKSGAMFFTGDTGFANDYTKINDLSLEELNSKGLRPNVRPVDLQYKNAWDHKNPKHRELIFDKILKEKYGASSHIDPEEAKKMTNMMLEHGSWRTIEPQFEHIKSLGFDAIKFTEQGKPNIALFNPENVRSVFQRPAQRIPGRINFNAPPAENIFDLAFKNLGLSVVSTGKDKPGATLSGGKFIELHKNKGATVEDITRSIGHEVAHKQQIRNGSLSNYDADFLTRARTETEAEAFGHVAAGDSLDVASAKARSWFVGHLNDAKNTYRRPDPTQELMSQTKGILDSIAPRTQALMDGLIEDGLASPKLFQRPAQAVGHEMKHSFQAKAFKSESSFNDAYNGETGLKGYNKNRFEVDARGFESRMMLEDVPKNIEKEALEYLDKLPYRKPSIINRTGGRAASNAAHITSNAASSIKGKSFGNIASKGYKILSKVI
jgi:hypothetical protein